MHEYIRNLFDFLSNAIIIFVCLCIEHAIRKFQIERFVLIRFETDAMKNMNIVKFCFLRMMTLKLTFQIRYQRIFDMQTIRKKNMIRKILFKRIKRIIDVNNASHIYNVTAVKDSYRIDVNDLSMNELNDDEEFDDDVEETNNEKRSIIIQITTWIVTWTSIQNQLMNLEMSRHLKMWRWENFICIE